MTQEDVLNFAKALNATIRNNDTEKFTKLIEETSTSEVYEFLKSVLDTYIDVHTPQQEQNFVKNWQDSHEDRKILDFGPANEDEDFQDDEGDSTIIININIDKLIW